MRSQRGLDPLGPLISRVSEGPDPLRPLSSRISGTSGSSEGVKMICFWPVFEGLFGEGQKDPILYVQTDKTRKKGVKKGVKKGSKRGQKGGQKAPNDPKCTKLHTKCPKITCFLDPFWDVFLRV